MLRTLITQWRTVLIGMLMVVTTTGLFYVITAYTPSFGKTVLRLSAADGLIVMLCVGVLNMVWLPLAGALSDRIGRRPILLASSVLVMRTAYPAMLWLASAPQYWRLLTVELWLSFLCASYNGAVVVALTELVPARVRTTGFLLAYSLATYIGGFTPAICTALIQLTGNRAMPVLWLTLAAACGAVAALLAGPAIARRRRGATANVIPVGR